MYPCDAIVGRQTPGLYTYYAIMSLMVVILAVSLIWVPVVHLITELNTIITKVVIYANRELLGYSNNSFSNKLESAFLSKGTLSFISFCFISYAMYLASNNFLIFAGCYICHLPNHKCLQKLKKLALEVIEYLLNLTGKNKNTPYSGNITVNYHNHHNS